MKIIESQKFNRIPLVVNDGRKELGYKLLEYHGGQWSPLYSVGSSWVAGKDVPVEVIGEAILELKDFLEDNSASDKVKQEVKSLQQKIKSEIQKTLDKDKTNKVLAEVKNYKKIIKGQFDPFKVDFKEESIRAKKMSTNSLLVALKDAIEASQVSPNAGKYTDQASVYRRELEIRGISIAEQDRKLEKTPSPHYDPFAGKNANKVIAEVKSYKKIIKGQYDPFKVDFKEEEKKARKNDIDSLFIALKDAIEASKVSPNSGKYTDQASIYSKELQRRGFSTDEINNRLMKTISTHYAPFSEKNKDGRYLNKSDLINQKFEKQSK